MRTKFTSIALAFSLALAFATSAWAQTLVDEGVFEDSDGSEPSAVEGAGTIDPDYPLFAGNDVPGTIDNVQIDVATDANIVAFSGVDAWGAAFDSASRTLYHNDGDQLYEWTGGVPVLLGTIMDSFGANVTIHGLAWYDGTLYGSSISTDTIYTIDPGTQMATVHVALTDTGASLSGLAADPTNGDLYATDDGTNDGLVRINLDGSLTLIAAYLGGETDVDGLAIGPDRRAYLITDDNTPPEFNVYDLAADSYVDTVAYPWGEDGAVQVSGAWVGDGSTVEPDPRATIAVQKAYSDDNPTPAEITLSCNTGLPLEQNYSLDPDRFGNIYVEFVITDFEDGTMDCEVTEEVLNGYEPTYLAFNDNQITDSGESCVFEDIAHGEVATSNQEEVNHVCFIGNTLLESEVVVTKEWIDENPQFNNPYYAEASYSCSNLPTVNFGFILPILGGEVQLSGEGPLPPTSGNLEFIGNPGTDSFLTLGNWDGGTVCTVTEQVVEGGVETDSSDCASVIVVPGEDATCTIVNTRLYEGIPTLSQYGLGLLALLMLGMGFVAYRRIV